jgi:hypothetical protein
MIDRKVTAMNEPTFTAAVIVLALIVTPTLAQQGNPLNPPNNPYAPQNNWYAPKKNLSNPDDGQLGGRNATYDNNGSPAVPKADGSGVNIFHTDGE